MADNPVLRYTVFGLVVVAAILAFASWLVRTRRVSPFGRLGRTLRTVSDPVLKPVEKRLYRMGGNPVHAGIWLVIITGVAGLLFLSLAGWFVSSFERVHAAATSGTAATFALIIDVAYRILFAALIVRVVATWFGMYDYSRWIRPAYILTDWLVVPLRRILPLVGAFDLSPLVAMIVLSIARSIIISHL
jgi:YggT family protein